MAKYPENIKAAVAISCPWDIKVLSEEIKRPSKFIYNMAITKNFIRNMKWNIEVYEKAGIDTSNKINIIRFCF